MSHSLISRTNQNLPRAKPTVCCKSKAASQQQQRHSHPSEKRHPTLLSLSQNKFSFQECGQPDHNCRLNIPNRDNTPRMSPRRFDGFCHELDQEVMPDLPNGPLMYLITRFSRLLRNRFHLLIQGTPGTQDRPKLQGSVAVPVKFALRSSDGTVWRVRTP